MCCDCSQFSCQLKPENITRDILCVKDCLGDFGVTVFEGKPVKFLSVSKINGIRPCVV